MMVREDMGGSRECSKARSCARLCSPQTSFESVSTLTTKCGIFSGRASLPAKANFLTGTPSQSNYPADHTPPYPWTILDRETGERWEHLISGIGFRLVGRRPVTP